MKSSEINHPLREHGSHATIGSRFARALQGVASAAVIGVTLFSASTSALAGIPGLDVNVTSLVPVNPGTTVRPIAYSVSGGATYQAAYAVQIANNTNSQINDIFFSALTSVSASGLSAPFVSPVTGLRSTDSCVVTATRVDCHFVSLPPGSDPISFILLVTSPVSSGPESLLSVSWGVLTGQGKVNPSNFIHQGSQDVTLHVGSAKDGVQSYVIAHNNLKVADGSASTNVNTPKSFTVGLQQVVDPSSCSPHYKQCFQSTIRIVDPFALTEVPVPFDAADPLVIDLFRPSSSLKKNADFANAQLFYKSGLGSDPLVPIPTCAPGAPGTTGPFGIPAAYPYRCVTPQVLPYATTGTTGVDALGNWYFHILGLYNGITNW